MPNENVLELKRKTFASNAILRKQINFPNEIEFFSIT